MSLLTCGTYETAAQQDDGAEAEAEQAECLDAGLHSRPGFGIDEEGPRCAPARHDAWTYQTASSASSALGGAAVHGTKASGRGHAWVEYVSPRCLRVK